MKLFRIKRLLENLLHSLFPVFLGILGVLGLLYGSSFPVIKKIYCQTQYGPCTEELSRSFSPLLGKNLLLTGRGVVRNFVKDRDDVRDIQVKRRLPDTFFINASVRKAKVALSEGEKLTLVDLEGKIVSGAGESSLPRLVVEDFSKTEDEDLKWAIKILVNLHGLGITAQAEFVGQDLVLQLRPAGTLVYVSQSGDPMTIAGSLQFMLGRFTMEGKQPRKIDLRFKNPVVVF